MPLGKSIFSPFSYQWQCFASGNEEDIWMSAVLVGHREASVLCAAVLVGYREVSVLCAAVLVEYRVLYCVLLFWWDTESSVLRAAVCWDTESSVLCAAVCWDTESSVLCASESLWQRRVELVQLVGHHFKKHTKKTHKVQVENL